MVNTTLMNRFEIVERLGSGGFGTVYRAWDARLEREVAVKVIETETGSAARTRREAQAAARLNHPGIVGLYEFVQHEYGPGDSRAFLVSELVEGPTLRELIDGDLLSDREVAGIAAETARSLEHAHSRGVVHRDVKPSNLIRSDETGQTKLMDFGVARLAGVEELTAAGDVLGTLAYMAPEQSEGAEAGPEADVYSLGLTLFEAWTGTNPRRGRTAGETVLAATRELPPLSSYRPDLPVELTDLIDECLDLDPEWRPSATELAEGVERVAGRLEAAPPAPREFRAGPGAADDRGWAVRTVTGIAMAAASATVLGLAGVGDLASVAATALAVGLASLASPRLGFPLTGLATAAWLGFAGGLWGAAFALGLVWILPGLLVPGPALALLAIPASPLAGLAGLAPAGAVLAAFAGRARDRALIAAASLATAAGAEAISGRKFLFGDIPKAAPDWSKTPLTLLTEVIWPVVSSSSFPIALAIWIAVAVVGGLVVDRVAHRSRAAPRGFEPSGVGSEGVTDVR